MAITKIGTPELFDFSATNTALQLPTGDTASRPATPSTGEWRFNSELKYVEYYDGGAWRQIDTEAVAPTFKAAENFNTNTYFGNGATQVIDAKFNEAANFNGTSSKITTNGKPMGSSDTLTISFWAKNISLAIIDYCSLFGEGGDADFAGYRVLIKNSNDGNMCLSRSEGDGNYVFPDSYFYDFGTEGSSWVHCVMTASATQIKYYKNGVNELTQNVSNTSTAVPDGNLLIGQDPQYTSRFVGGNLDQIRIFNTTLTDAQVSTLYAETTTTAATLDFPAGAGCVAAYQFDGNANDISNTYNGTPTDIGYTGLQFEADLIWVKIRNLAYDHELTDTIRGTDSQLRSNLTISEVGAADGITSFTSTNGFIVGSAGGWNGNNNSYVAWSWKAGGAPTATNSAGAGNVPTAGSVKIDGADSTTALAGTIAATNISANTAAGFSIVRYTGNGTSGATIGHGLSSPEMVIAKGINGGNTSWWVSHKNIGTDVLELNSSATKASYSSVFNNIAPSPTVVTLGNGDTNRSGNTQILYCFQSIANYQKIDSYIGDGNATGPIVPTGFKPGFLMIKAVSATPEEPWLIYDSSRNESNPRSCHLRPNTTSISQCNSDAVDFNATNFQIKSNWDAFNKVNEVYVYLAIA